MKLHNLLSLEKTQHEEIHQWAIEQHRITGCKYSGYDYDLHLNAVLNVGKQYLYLIATEHKYEVLCAISCHDLIEDARVSHKDIKNKTQSELCADIVYNVTNELGRNRKERSTKTYPKIASCQYSTFVKLCDRIGNLKFSYFCNDEKGMFEMYKQESPEFFKSLHNSEHGFEDMWKELNALTLM